MIEHIVLFKWQPDTSPEAIATIIEALKSLQDKIPGIVDLSCGENFCERSKGFTHGLVVRFVDRAALENYGPHPEHQAIVQELIKPVLLDILALDFAIEC
ncbi:Dabb family protein [Desertifilum sp. FACHB-1129]|uniref:Stress protein n=1 Tax=Desertifilum tharense IPPAS B-1220 TaxID=1781255 RepID=A0A1E5QGW1_9CYAN|nr:MULTISPECIES: Dabb family protein [Desertifilum]MDA0209557.1 Dabb family protein [Cyanobacteria bacterium FC1]MBD2312967.1 Dabb family protein [Desertifilum sp. FACHB-1129]MBD2320987.1 Dabb family protein [Desertifilum sp. FACHB-866]MBD2331116.1 Dabb family protein [Desertifilum sp. FACHB-868]OEJ73926.1 stress protein [Desertifilum tharense IPPAS B-1220]